MMRASVIALLEGALERSKDRRKTWFGEVKTSKAQAAEAVLLAYVPILIAESRANTERLARSKGYAVKTSTTIGSVK